MGIFGGTGSKQTWRNLVRIVIARIEVVNRKKQIESKNLREEDVPGTILPGKNTRRMHRETGAAMAS